MGAARKFEERRRQRTNQQQTPRNSNTRVFLDTKVPTLYFRGHLEMAGALFQSGWHPQQSIVIFCSFFGCEILVEDLRRDSCADCLVAYYSSTRTRVTCQ